MDSAAEVCAEAQKPSRILTRNANTPELDTTLWRGPEQIARQANLSAAKPGIHSFTFLCVTFAALLRDSKTDLTLSDEQQTR